MSNCRDPEEISQIYQAIIAGQKLVEASPSDEELLEELGPAQTGHVKGDSAF